MPDLEKGGEQTELLLDLYLKNSNWDQAVSLAVRVFEADQKNFGPMEKVVEVRNQKKTVSTRRVRKTFASVSTSVTAA